MKRVYAITIEDGEVTGLVYEVLTCQECRFFRKAEEHEYRYKDSCDNPAGLVRPYPDSWCSYGREHDYE